MGTLVVLVLVAVAGWVVWKLLKSPDANNDGVVDHKDVVVAVKEVAEETKAAAVSVADVNKDGKVDLADVKAAAAKVKKGRKKKAQ
jgi:predicted negative regulator of RcsB-dependent stress response